MQYLNGTAVVLYRVCMFPLSLLLDPHLLKVEQSCLGTVLVFHWALLYTNHHHHSGGGDM